MNNAETAELLREVAILDNRKVSQDLIDQWQSILGHIPLDIAREAHKLARKDERVTYLEPRHIVSWAREAAYKLDRAKGNTVPEELEGKSVPQPKCREHSRPIMVCDACCRKLAPLADKNKNEILIYAQKNVYA